MKQARLFYRPETGVSADFIPFWENGTYYLFYLRDYRDKDRCGEGTPWFLITTQDFIHFQEHGEILPRGTAEDQDLYVFTGSVTKVGGKYHIWYTGHNPHFQKDGWPVEAVMHAVSPDLFHWEKIPGDTFYAPSGQYEPDDWRDPFVYSDGSDSYQMILAARTTEGSERRRGVTAQCVSRDGVHWRVAKRPFWAPDLYYTHECPDLFRIGDWYYLVFSEFSQDKVTRYRMSRSPEGPWLTPLDDRFDGCAFYAAKTASSSAQRHLFGWLATREGNTDVGNWQWGGCLVVHELVQRRDGTLAVRLPKAIRDTYQAKMVREPVILDGALQLDRKNCGMLEEVCLLDLQISTDGDGGSLSIALWADEALEESAFLRLEFNRRRIVVDRWPRAAHQTFEPGLERPFPTHTGGSLHLQILIDGTAACAYLDDEIALCFRVYHRGGPFWGVVAENIKAYISKNDSY